MKMTAKFKIWLLLCTVLLQVNANQNDEVTSLPGINFNLPFKHYSGYLEAANGDNLFYWFFESQTNPQKDPLVLWLNGGPGCSSLLGALTELGPLRILSNNSFELNSFAWNVRSNVLFLESPALVGFSYNANGSYDKTDDESTAITNLAALKSFFRKFPHLKNNDFYITGESYAGIYIPTLSLLALQENFPPNFKGFAIGNGLLDIKLIQNADLPFYHYHGIIDASNWNQLLETCCANVTRVRDCDFNGNVSKNSNCKKVYFKAIQALMQAFLNQYNIYDPCPTIGSRNVNLKNYSKWTKKSISQTLVQPDNCVDTDKLLIQYLNQAVVKEALHVITNNHTHSQWNPCNNGYQSFHNFSMLNQIRKLLKSGLKGLIYYGDVDSVCNFLGGMWFAEDLGLKVTKDYSPWMVNGQVGGFMKQFQNLTYSTVRGAGHMVPTDRPQAAQFMFHSFLLDA